MPENTQPENTGQAPEIAASENAGTGGSAEEQPSPSGTRADASETAPEGRPEMATSYERTPEGHRVTRRTVSRREVTEETQETITETYPVPYQPPSPTGHPAPVG
ncbi:hypothetical protein ACT8ZV_12175 [Nocardioides sp. MAHUQ-72]|uniref:hypothetical protein n=1 Tax=unclassified Nocardioides TaxID=2615069 RepID=UPI003623AD12